MKFRALVDSGAEVSLIHSRIFASLKDKPKVFKKKAHLQSVSGQALNTLIMGFLMTSVLVSLMIKSPSIKFVLSTCGIARATVISPIFWVMHLGREPYPFWASSEKHYEFNRPNRRMTKPPPVIDKRVPESMEVDHFRSQKRCYPCGKFGKPLISFFVILITVEFGEPVKLIAYCGNLLLSWASL
jgi:hypothetical protein